MKKRIGSLVFIAWLLLLQLCLTGFAFALIPVDQKEPAFLFISDEMRQFLDKHVMKTASQNGRLRILIDSIFDGTLLNFKYSNNKTYTAQETFKNRTGNCLSYTAMFIVMARYVGIPACFQEVHYYSNWTKKENTITFNRHMNALAEVDGKEIEVDFYFSNEKKFQRAKVVSDQRAQAHYYNNIGAEALIAKTYGMAESLFKKAIEKDEQFSPAWSNIGLLYQYMGKMKLAARSYKRAIFLDKTNFTAQLNLSNLYRIHGNIKKAEKIRRRIKKFCLKNPFYHYRLGLTSYGKAMFKLAIEHYKRAIKRNSREPEFYLKIAAAYFKLSDHKAVEKYLKKARKFAKSFKDRNLYNKKLNYLHSHYEKTKK